jgi:hypothetical protein
VRSVQTHSLRQMSLTPLDPGAQSILIKKDFGCCTDLNAGLSHRHVSSMRAAGSRADVKLNSWPLLQPSLHLPKPHPRPYEPPGEEEGTSQSSFAGAGDLDLPHMPAHSLASAQSSLLLPVQQVQTLVSSSYLSQAQPINWPECSVSL